MEDGFFGDIVQPAIRFIATAVVAFLPLGLFVACRMYSQIPRELTLVLAAGALGVGLFFWPIVMLLFSLKTASTLLQIHLVIMTVVRTILPYLALWLMLIVVGTIAITTTFSVALSALALGINWLTSLGTRMGISVAIDLVGTYLTVV